MGFADPDFSKVRLGFRYYTLFAPIFFPVMILSYANQPDLSSCYLCLVMLFNNLIKKNVL